MNTKDLKAYAPKARRDFIAAVTKQAQKYGVTEAVTHPVEINGNVCVVNGNPFPASMASRINKLGERVKNNGFEQTMEQVAYSWFNRLIAIRYMELHDYLGHGRRVLSHPEHPTGFQILEECTELSYGNSGEAGELPDLTHERVVELKLDGTKDEELYRELLLAQCHALHKAMPFLFETIDDETELLLPENLTKTDSLIHDLITDLAESDWESIEVVGWLYQFYISEKKDEVIGKVVKSEDIPAATQLFTPNWIVKYMVQNSLGAQWLATYPESPLKAEMEYYIEPAEQTDEVNCQLKEITPDELNPEELTLIDPASGSGHILVEAYDLFKAIYLERGYRSRDIAQLILEKNLFGLDIDQRAAQLTGFALMMKGREDDRRLFERGVKLNVMAMVDSTSLDVETLVHGIDLAQYGLNEENLTELKELFELATTFGSLIQVPEQLAEKLSALKQLGESNSQDMFVSEVLEHLAPLVKQAEILAAQYDAVVANPPYMGGKGMNPVVKTFVKNNFPDAKNDLFSCFIERGYSLAATNGHNAMITMQSWMFLSSFEAMRTNMLATKTIISMAHLGARAFGSISGEVVQTTACVLKNLSTSDFKPTFFRLLEGNEEAKRTALIAGENRFNETAQDEFKKIPGSPIAYWVSDHTREIFEMGTPLSNIAKPRVGMRTGDNERFLRLWHEVSIADSNSSSTSALNASNTGKKWFPFVKGGDFRKWFGNVEQLVNWKNDGYEIKEDTLKKYPQLSWDNLGWKISNESYYFRSAITWTAVSSSCFGVRFVDKGNIFGTGGSCIFPTGSMFEQLGALLCSNVGHYLMGIGNPTLNINIEDVAAIPILGELQDSVIEIAKLCRDFSRMDWNAYERSWDFQSLPILSTSSESNTTFESSYNSWIAQNCATITEMKRLEEENNHLFTDAYGLADELSPEVPIEQITLTVNPAYRYGVKGTEEERNTRFREDTMAELVSYAVGCMMGRYSLDEPGLIYANSGNGGFDASRYTKFSADDDGIIPLTDKEWFTDDAANRLVEFISVAWDKTHLEENLNFLAANLSPKKGEDSRDTIRRYLCDKFYKDHMQTYKKRPIYWLFSSGKQKAFQCLVYLHRYNESTLARMRTEYVIPLTAKLSSHIEKLENDKGASGSAAEIKKLEKEIKSLHKQQTELTEFDEKLKHYADMRIPLDLDDGVKENYGNFGDLLAEVTAIHGKKPEVLS
jgi:type II restriction/modification system DNA methylase subunit YeeA